MSPARGPRVLDYRAFLVLASQEDLSEGEAHAFYRVNVDNWTAHQRANFTAEWGEPQPPKET